MPPRRRAPRTNGTEPVTAQPTTGGATTGGTATGAATPTTGGTITGGATTDGAAAEAAAGAGGAAPRVPLRVLTYNIHGQQDDVAALARVVRDVAPDVVVVQEGPRRLRWRTRAADLARRCGLFSGGGGAPAAGNLLLLGQRVRVLETWSVLFPLNPRHHLRGVAFARCVLDWGDASAPDSPFVVAGTHLSTDPEQRVRQAGLLAPVLAGRSEPVLLGADLNEPPDGPAWKQFHAAGLRDAAAEGVAAGTAAPTFSVASPRHRLDALLVGDGWQVTGHRVVDTPDARLASDHFPVLAELTPVAAG
jgi:endonuclease/exonuclease/phosphatase family metal-dependent hydrolase